MVSESNPIISNSMDVDTDGLDLADESEIRLDEPALDIENDLIDNHDLPKEIFAKQDVNEIKGLLDENDSIGDEMKTIKIENSELASLTEEALSEALGESNYENIADDDIEKMFEENKDDSGLDINPALLDSAILNSSKELQEVANEKLGDVVEAPQSNLAEVQKAEAVNQVANSVSGLSVASLRDLLDGMQITINISFPKK